MGGCNLNSTGTNLSFLQARLCTQLLQSNSSNIIIAAGRRLGKTYSACQWVRKQILAGKKGFYVPRNHKLAREVTQRLDRLGLRVLHLAGRKHRLLDYKTRNSITPREFYKKYRGKVKAAQELLENGEIDVIVTVPELAVRLNPADFLVLDEVTTLFWFKHFSNPVWEVIHEDGDKHVANLVAKALAKGLVKDLRVKTYLQKVNEKLRLVENILEVLNPTTAARVIEEELNGIPTPLQSLQKDCEEAWGRPVTLQEVEEQVTPLIKQQIQDIKAGITEPKDEKYQELIPFALSLYRLQKWLAIPQTRTVKVWAKIKPILLFEDWLKAFEQILVCVPLDRLSHAKEFFSQLGRESEVIKEERVPYMGNYTLFVTDNVYKLGAKLYENQIPVLWVTGRKQDAVRLKSKLAEYGISAIPVEEQPVEEVRRYAKRGMHVIVYLNSRVSQGIDLPEFNVVIVDSYRFGCIDLIPVEEFACALWDTILRTVYTPEQRNAGRLMPKVVIFKQVKKRSNTEKDFCDWFAQSAGVTPVTDKRRWEAVVNSTWLPGYEIPTIPIYASWRSLAKLNYLFSATVEKWEEVGEDIKITDLLAARDGELINTIKIGDSTMVNPAAIREYWVVQLLFGEKVKKVILNRKRPNLFGLLAQLSGRRLYSIEVYKAFKTSGLATKKIVAEILKDWESRGLLTKQKEGRRVIYSFTDLLARFTRLLEGCTYEPQHRLLWQFLVEYMHKEWIEATQFEGRISKYIQPTRNMYTYNGPAPEL